MPGTQNRKATQLSAAALARTQVQRGHPSMPSPRWMDEVLPPLLQSFGAFGCQFGRKHRRGRWLKEPAIAFFTQDKHDPVAGPGIQPIPEWLSWKDGRHRHRLRTDVLQVASTIELQAGTVYGPGDGVASGTDAATIGAAVRRPGGGGTFLTTAGHLFGDGAQGRAAQVTSDGATAPVIVDQSFVRNAIDYALLRPTTPAPCDNLFRNHVRIGPVYNATPRDAGTPLMVLDRTGQATRTVCRGVGVQIGDYRGLITTDPATRATYSGGALIDDANRLWGFVLGTLGGDKSLFIPAQLIFDHAGVVLI